MTITTKPIPKEKINKAPVRRPTQMTPEAFKEARIGLGLSQQALADLAGTGRVPISNMESGKIRVNGQWKLIIDLLQERENLRRLLGQEPTFKCKGLK